MHIIHPVSGKGAAFPEPGVFGFVAVGFLAAVFFPFDVGFYAEEAGAFLAAGEVGGHEGADVHADAVVEVGVPADGLLRERFPANEEVVGWPAFGDELEAWRYTLDSGKSIVRGRTTAQGATETVSLNL